MKNIFRYWIPWGLAALFLIYLATRSGSQLPRFFPGADKIFHFAYYLVLGFLSARLSFYRLGKTPDTKRLAQLTAVLSTLFFGLIDESIQSFRPGRDIDFWDLVADLCGGIVAAWLFPLYRSKVPVWEAKLATYFRKT